MVLELVFGSSSWPQRRHSVGWLFWLTTSGMAMPIGPTWMVIITQWMSCSTCWMQGASDVRNQGLMYMEKGYNSCQLKSQIVYAIHVVHWPWFAFLAMLWCSMVTCTLSRQSMLKLLDYLAPPCPVCLLYPWQSSWASSNRGVFVDGGLRRWDVQWEC